MIEAVGLRHEVVHLTRPSGARPPVRTVSKSQYSPPSAYDIRSTSTWELFGSRRGFHVPFGPGYGRSQTTTIINSPSRPFAASTSETYPSMATSQQIYVR